MNDLARLQDYVNRHNGETITFSKPGDTPSLIDRDMEAYEIGLSGAPIPARIKGTMAEYSWRLGANGLSIFDSFNEAEIFSKIYKK